jgi:hypothetical protein
MDWKTLKLEIPEEVNVPEAKKGLSPGYRL